MSLQAQQITKAEYFFDNDPGSGLAIPLSITPGDSLNLTSGINVGALSQGFHTLCVRVYGSTVIYNATIKYTTGQSPSVTGITTTLGSSWSIYDSRSFYVTVPTVIPTIPGITAAEYYFDNDPGVGNGIALSPIANLDSVNITSNVNIGALTPGFHKLMVRTKDQRGIWSIYDSRAFYVPAGTPVNTVPGIVAAEYYFDNDPGPGKGFALAPIADLDSVNISSNINIGTLTSGFHTVMIRTKDQRGVWGIYDSRSFYVPPMVSIPTVPGIAAAEYYYDNDPGVGKGIALPAFSIADSVNLTNNLPVGTLTGFHTVLIRVKDQRGIWSIYDSRNFYVKPNTPVVTASGIAKMEYFVDNDPGPGKGISLSTGPVSDSVNVTLDMALTTVASGFHNIGIRVRNAQGLWSQLDAKNIYIKPPPIVAVPDPINYAEYYFNHSDPGFGKATPITLGTFADSINITTNLNASSLFIGADTVNLRVRTQSGKFSQTVSRAFTVCNNAPQAKFKFDTVCTGGPTHFINLTTGDNASTAYSWDFRSLGVTNSTVASSVNFTYPSPGTYIAKLTVSNGGPCFSVFTAQIAVISGVPAQPSPISGFISVCKGIQKYSITSVNFTKYAWNNPVLGTLTTNTRKDTASINWTSTGSNDLIQVIPSNACGTGPAATLYVSVSNALSVSAGSNVAICKGDSVVLSASSASSYLWLNTGETTQSIKVKPAVTTGYIVQASQSNCTGKDTVIVFVTTVPSQLTITQKNDTLVTTAITGGVYQWYFAGLQVGPGLPRFIPQYDGIYNVKVSIGSCSSTLSSDFNYVKPAQACTSQTLTFTGIPDKTLANAPFAIPASVSSGLPILFSVVSGPAVLINSNTLSLTGAGIVAISATQGGDATYCATGIITRYFQVTCANQSVFFNSLPDKIIGSPAFPVSATVTSGLPVTFSIVSGPATLIGGNMISLTGIGGVAVSASQSGNATFCGANTVTQYFQVTNPPFTCTSQNITFPAIPDKQVNAPAFALVATVSSGLLPLFNVSGPAVLVSGNTLSITGSGIVVVTASQPGNATFCGAASVTNYFQVTSTITGCSSQTIFFNPLPDKNTGDAPFAVTATVTSGLAPTFTIVSGPAVLLSGNIVSFSGSGIIGVTASQAGDATYCAANTVTRYFQVSCANQNIIFNSLPNKAVGDPAFPVSATVTSGLIPTFSILSGPAVILSGNMISLTGAGGVAVSASQSGNLTFCGASTITQYFQVIGSGVSKSDQSITFDSIPDRFQNDPPVVLSATASSGLRVYYNIVSGPAVLIGDTLKTVGTGTVVVKAIQPGNSIYNAAPDVVHAFNVVGIVPRQPQVITFILSGSRLTTDPPLRLFAAATSGLKINFTLISGPAFIVNDTLKITGKGLVVIKASQPGNSLYFPADSVIQNIQVAEPGCPFIAAPAITSKGIFCSGDLMEIFAGTIENATTYTWISPDNTTTTSQNISVSNVSVNASGNYSIMASAGNCSSALSYANIIIRQKPDKPQISLVSGDICKNNSVLSVLPNSGSYKWYLNGYWVVNADSNVYIPGITGTYGIQVSDSTKTCFTTSDNYIFTFSGMGQQPVITAASDQSQLSSSEAATYKWYLGKRLIIGANDQNLSIQFNGLYKVQTTYANGCEFISDGYNINRADLKDIIRSGAILTDSTIVFMEKTNDAIEVFPNPATGSFTVKYIGQKELIANCRLYNTNGVQIAEKSMISSGDKLSYIEFNVSDVASGFYFIKIIDGSKVKCAKVTVY